VTVIVASILGALAYHESRGQTEALQIQLATQPDLDPGVAAGLESFGRDRDRAILLSIITGIGVLTIALGLTGIIVTHKMVGPAYKIRLLLASVAKGHLRVDSGLRRGDELQDVFAAFNDMVSQLRARRESDLERLETALHTATTEHGSQELLQRLGEVRDRLRSELD
jgi:hypothetical protein